ncbi:MAG: hypothetical protein NDI73_00630 [Desulfuromonadales bacterium]|nr:hypothetical protein [Desulfuromonadales bacterium]
MFQWDKTIKSMGVPVEEVVHLHRSMRDVQLALPGLPAQEATAYLCQHKTSQGVGTIIAFHLHKSSQLAFYVDSPIVVAAGKADAILDQTLMFVESMGFLMTDLDIHLLSVSDKVMLWSSLPLQNGLQEAEKSTPPKAAAATPVQKAPPAVMPAVPKIALPDEKIVPAVTVAEQRQQEDLPAETEANGQANVDDLLAAVEELRTRRPGVRSRKKPPSPDELNRRRLELRESVGRILASL